MKLNYFFIFTMALFASCNNLESDAIESTQRVTAVIGASDVGSTRTAIDTDQTTVTWCVGDQVALWASGTTDGQSYIDGGMFQLNYYGTDYGTAEFSSTINALSTDQEYLYSAFYPFKTTINQGVVTYEIPAIQDGTYNGAYDYRVADPTIGRALDETILDNCVLSFRSITHALKISIPEGYGDDAVSKIAIIFSEVVAGNTSFDMNDMNSDPTLLDSGSLLKFTLSDGSECEYENGYIMTLDLGANTLTSGDGESAWLFMNPIKGLKAMSITALDTNNNILGTHNIDFDAGRDFDAGYITPVNFGANMEDAIPTTTLKFRMDGNNLGEDVNTLTVTAPDSKTFADGSTTTSDITPTGNDGEFSIECDILTFNNSVIDNAVTISYDSNSAIVSDVVKIISDNLSTDGYYKYTVPYLFFEDFSGVSDYSNHDTFDGTISSDSDHYAATLDSAGLVGWSGDRIGIDSLAGSIRTTCRLEGGGVGIYSNYRYTGRLDSAPIATIKSGKSIAVIITYDYSGGQEEGAGDEPATIWYDHSSTTTSGAIAAPTYEKWSVSWVTTHPIIYDYELAIGGSYTYIDKSTNYTISACTNATRLSWLIDVDRGFEFAQNGHYWLYIDNVRVSIK